MRNYKDYVAKKKAEYGDKFDTGELALKFIPYFENGKRIKVDLGYGIKFGTVGVTTGWKPNFLLMLQKRSTGSSVCLCASHEILGESK